MSATHTPVGVARDGAPITRSSIVAEADFAGACFALWTLERAPYLSYLATEAVPYRTDLRHTDFRGADLQDANLTGADLSWASLVDANLIEADCRDALLVDADLARADLRFTTFDGADLTGADLAGADIRQCDLRYVRNLTVDQVLTANYDFTTVFPTPITNALHRYHDLFARMNPRDQVASPSLSSPEGPTLARTLEDS